MVTKGLIQKHKKRARILLYACPLVVLLAYGLVIQNAASVSMMLDRDWVDIDYLEYESVRLFQEYLRCLLYTSAAADE